MSVKVNTLLKQSSTSKWGWTNFSRLFDVMPRRYIRSARLVVYEIVINVISITFALTCYADL